MYIDTDLVDQNDAVRRNKVQTGSVPNMVRVSFEVWYTRSFVETYRMDR